MQREVVSLRQQRKIANLIAIVKAVVHDVRCRVTSWKGIEKTTLVVFYVILSV